MAFSLDLRSYLLLMLLILGVPTVFSAIATITYATCAPGNGQTYTEYCTNAKSTDCCDFSLMVFPTLIKSGRCCSRQTCTSTNRVPIAEVCSYYTNSYCCQRFDDPYSIWSTCCNWLHSSYQKSERVSKSSFSSKTSMSKMMSSYKSDILNYISSLNDASQASSNSSFWGRYSSSRASQSSWDSYVRSLRGNVDDIRRSISDGQTSSGNEPSGGGITEVEGAIFAVMGVVFLVLVIVLPIVVGGKVAEKRVMKLLQEHADRRNTEAMAVPYVYVNEGQEPHGFDDHSP
ncbi:uncharacterized protein LOC135486605 [Lineus longissimus]|uniref:uncharacterized protein LOC135486605 n=1 Tax=Lineus longissimus TaxID=88925 RepID=UPI002B4C45CF